MTTDTAVQWLKDLLKNTDFPMPQYEEAIKTAIKAIDGKHKGWLIRMPCGQLLSISWLMELERKNKK